MGIDLKKEIRLSDLFRRRSQRPGEEGAEQAKPPKAKKSPKASKPPKERAPRERRALRFGRKMPEGGVSARTVPPLPQTPIMRAFNLLPSEHATEQARPGVGLAQVGVALGGLLAFAALAALYLFSSAGVTERKQDVDALEAQLATLRAPQEPGGEEVEAALAGERTARTTALAAALDGRLAWDRLLREFSLVLPENVSLQSLQAAAPVQAAGAAPADADAAAGANTFTIVGFTEEQEDVALLLSRLALLPEFTSVSLVSSTVSEQEGSGAEYVQFTIGAAIRQDRAGP
jgi:Tfp pilus assembly protein PilN